MKKTNVIIIMADQLRYDVLNEEYTPNIMKLKKDGVSFSNCYCACPLCAPARGAFFTGTYPNTNGSLINPWAKVDYSYGQVKVGIDNLYTLMENDWDSIHSGKQHLFTEGGNLENRTDSKTKFVSDGAKYRNFLKENGKRAPGGKEFTTFVPEMAQGQVTRAKRYSTPHTGCYEEGYDYFFDGYFTNQAIKALKSRKSEKPLLLNIMYLAPHPPLDIPEPWYSKYKDVTLPDNVGEWSKGQSPLQLYNLPGVVGSRYNKEDWKEAWRVYLGLVSLLDDSVGKVINELKSQDLYDDSLIIFTSDHGEMLGSHRMFQKMCMYEEAVKVPLYIKMPKGYEPCQNEFEQLISAIDVFPTLCEYLDLNVGHAVDGESLIPLLEGKKKVLDRNVCYIQFDGNGARSNFQRCVIKDGYKLIVDLFKDENYVELYHISEDPQEKENLALLGEYDHIGAELLLLLKEHMKKTKDQQNIKISSIEEFRNNYVKEGL